MRQEDHNLEKQALGWLMGPLGHVAVNAAGHTAHHASNLAEVLAHRGLQHGLTGSKINPVMQKVLKLFAGPEALIPYQAAHALGSKMKDLPTDKMHALLQGGAGALQNAPELGHAPILGSLQQAAQHELAGTEPQFRAKGLLSKLYGGLVNSGTSVADSPFDTTGRKVLRGALSAAPAAAAVAADPAGTLAHMGINRAREAIGTSALGGQLRAQLLQKGMQGEKLSPLKEKLINYGVSPAVLDPQRIGNALHEVGLGDVGQKALMAGQAVQQGRKAVGVLRGAAEKARAGLPELQQTLQQHVPGMLGTAQQHAQQFGQLAQQQGQSFLQGLPATGLEQHALGHIEQFAGHAAPVATSAAQQMKPAVGALQRASEPVVRPMQKAYRQVAQPMMQGGV